MEYEYRQKVLIVAWVDMIFTILGMVGMFLIIAVFAIAAANPSATNLHADLFNQFNATLQQQHPGTKLTQNDLNEAASTISTILIVCGIIGALISLLHLYICWNLKKSTQKERGRSNARSKAQCWMRFSIFILVCFCLSLFQGGMMFLVALPGVILRAVGIYIVWKYIQEINDSIVRLNSSQNI